MAGWKKIKIWGEESTPVQLWKAVNEINWCTTRLVMRPFNVNWMAIAIISRNHNCSLSVPLHDAFFSRLHGWM